MDTILAPSGTIDSGQTITPRCVVANYGDSTAGFWTFFVINDGAPDSLWLPDLGPSQRETLAFGVWVPQGRDSMAAVAWTRCEGDTNPANDTCRARFLVRVYDFHLQLMLPDTLYDSIPILPRARVWNYSNVPVRGYLGFRVDSTYYSRSLEFNLIAGGATVVAAQDSWYPKTCVMTCSLFILPADTCVAWDAETVYVRGNILADVDARAVLAPAGVVDTLTTITPSGRVGNLGTDPQLFWTFFIIQNAGGSTIYIDSSQVMLGPGDSTDITYRDTFITVIGNYTAAESVFLVGDQNPTNDVARKPFRVVPDLSSNVWLDSLFGPRETVYADTTIVAGVAVRCSGEGAHVRGLWVIYNRYGVRMYQQSFDCHVEPGESVVVTSTPFNVGNDSGGPYDFRCVIPAADSVMWKFWVVPRPGIEEGQPQVSSHKPQATVLQALPRGAVAFDATGRRVLNPKPGVYFVAERPGVRGQGPGKVRKVVVQR